MNNKNFPFYPEKPEIDEVGHELIKAHYRFLKDFELSELHAGCIIHVYDLKAKSFITGKVHSFTADKSLNYYMSYSAEEGWNGLTCNSACLDRYLFKVTA